LTFHSPNRFSMNLTYLTCVIVEDEPLAIEKLKDYVRQVHYLKLVRTFDNGIAAVSFLKNNPIDILFLDIQMDDLNGLQLLQLLEDKPYTILTTAYDEYALKGYELEVRDYLLKPIGLTHFLRAVERAFNAKQIILKGPSPMTPKPYDEYFFIRSNYQLVKVFFKDIIYLEAKNEQVILYCKDQKVVTGKTLQELEDKLSSPPFFRIHRSFIISFDFIERVNRHEVQVNGISLPLGDFYKRTFLNHVQEI